MMVERAFNLKDTFGTAVASNDAIWRCSNKWPLRINEQSTFRYLQVSMLQPNCFFIPVPGFLFMLATPVHLLRCKVKSFWVANALHQALCWICYICVTNSLHTRSSDPSCPVLKSEGCFALLSRFFLYCLCHVISYLYGNIVTGFQQIKII